MTKSRGLRRASTGREIKLIKHFALEGLSITRTRNALEELYGINLTYNQLRGYIQYQKIKFRGESGPPFGNQNAKRKSK